KILFADAGVEGEAGEKRQLLSRIAARDVERRVGFGEAGLLCVAERVGIGRAFFGHLRKNEVARAVDDADQRVNAVRDQPLLKRVDNRNAAAATGLERNAGVVLSR